MTSKEKGRIWQAANQWHATSLPEFVLMPPGENTNSADVTNHGHALRYLTSSSDL
jgi:hypothetical protein